ncbi:hypothetical protein FSPOR_5512 [Fusarium sporotrichioides]|uniref:Uncharacterized protein n=1 Tax=Fusarium sporotrichioides TaxID=5514 RepID=A0A395S6J6_FUSSP|nr:hypothetical protein FSPOR_5512 [Fusarium sporotrichioides]
MNSPKPPPSQPSSHFPLEPIPASVLAEKEARRRDAIALLGPCKTGCAVVDEDILLGGFDRASIVGVSAEDEELGVQPASVMLTGLRDAIKAELQKRAGTQDIKTRLRECLDKVMLSRVFDLDGLWEVLADLDPKQPVDEEAVLLHQEKETQKQDATEAQVEEIQDSQDDDDEAFSPIRQASQPPLHEENSASKATPHPEVVVMTHFSSLLTSLFAHREKSAARTALQLLGSRLRDLSRNLPSNPLILLLNSTSSSFSGPASTTTTTSSAKQAFIDPTLRSIFNPPSATGYSSRRTKPNFGLSFTQLLDLHILCTRIPKTRTDAELAVQPRSGEEAKMVWAVEVLLDEMGVWEGKLGARTGREQRWTAIDVVKGRIERLAAGLGGGEFNEECEALAQCLQESECVMVQRNSAGDCLREPLVNTLPLKCRQLKKGFGECKRGMVDMRKRFRGNMPVAYRTMEQAEEGQGYQLYAGRPAFAGGVKKTDGNEPIPQDWREVENEKWKAEQAAVAQQKK